MTRRKGNMLNSQTKIKTRPLMNYEIRGMTVDEVWVGFFELSPGLQIAE